MSEYDEFKHLVDVRKRAGQRRRDVLQFVAQNPNATPYKIAKAVYGNPLVYHRTVLNMLDKLERTVPGIFGVAREKSARGEFRWYSLSEKGKDMCKREGIIVLTEEADQLVKCINGKMPTEAPLTFEESKTIYSALTKKVCKTAGEIYRSSHQATDVDIGYQILAGVWAYETEREVKGQYKFYPEDVARWYAPVIKAGLVPKNKIKKWAMIEGKKYIIPEVEKRLQTSKMAESADAKKDFDNFLTVLDPIVKRAPILITLKEEVTRSHQAYVAKKLLAEVTPIAVRRSLELMMTGVPSRRKRGNE